VASESRFPDGVWQGSLDILPTTADEPWAAKPYRIALAACAGDVRVWYQRKDGLYDTPKPRFGVESKLGSYAIRFIDSEPVPDPSWVETQALMLVAMPDSEFRVHWSRAVNNRLKTDSDPYRFVFQHGVGTIRRTSEACEPGRVFPPGTEQRP